MKFIDFYRYSEKGIEIIEAFREKGLTLYEVKVLIRLYKEACSRQEIKRRVGLTNNGQLSRDVIMPLVAKGYISRIKNKDCTINLQINREGKNLLEKIMKEIGYSLK